MDTHYQLSSARLETFYLAVKKFFGRQHYYLPVHLVIGFQYVVNCEKSKTRSGGFCFFFAGYH